MLNFKKCSALIFSALICFASYGCSLNFTGSTNDSSSTSSENKTPNNSQEVQKVSDDDLFQQAIENFYCSTSYHCYEKLTATNPSLFDPSLRHYESEGYSPKLFEKNTDYIIDLKKNSENKAEEYRYTKYSASQKVDYTNGKSDTANFYYQNDGYKYSKTDNSKTKSKDLSGPTVHYVEIKKGVFKKEYIENLSVTTENSQKIFNFKIKADDIDSYGGVLNSSSNISLTSYSGTIITDENNNILKFVINKEYKDSSNGGTANNIVEYTNINNTNVELPSDLSTYKDSLF